MNFTQGPLSTLSSQEGHLQEAGNSESAKPNPVIHVSKGYVFLQSLKSSYIVVECISCAADTHLATDLTRWSLRSIDISWDLVACPELGLFDRSYAEGCGG